MAIGSATTGSRPLEALRRAFSAWSLADSSCCSIILVSWEIYAQFFADRALLAAPSEVVAALGPKIFGDPAVFAAIRLTLYELAIAFALSIVIGLAIEISLGLSEFGRNGVLPIVLLLYAIPQVSIVAARGHDVRHRAALKNRIWLQSWRFSGHPYTVAGMRSVSPLLLRGAKSTGATRLQLIRHVIFPHMVPTIFAGFAWR